MSSASARGSRENAPINCPSRIIQHQFDRYIVVEVLRLLLDSRLISDVMTDVGSVQGGNPVLYAINDSWFPFGATLSGNVLLFNGKQPDTTLTALVGALAASAVGVSAVMCTQPGSSCCLALRTADIFQNPQQLNGPEATFIAQLVF